MTSSWSHGHGAAVRLLISGQRTEDGALLGGIEFDLAPGWKTYWRNPGEAGIAPDIKFTKSSGVDRVEVLYPAPERFEDAYGNAIVYKSDVVFPIKIWPSLPTAALHLHVALFVGVCETICVPFEAELGALIPAAMPVDPAIGKTIDRALANVPKRVSAGVLKEQHAIDIAFAPAGPTAEPGFRLLQVSGQEISSDVDLFLETFSGAFVPVPRKLPPTAGAAQFEVDLTRLTAEETEIIVTLVQRTKSDFSAEIALPLDR